MKTYYTTSQTGVFFDAASGGGFETGSPQHTKMLAEIEAGTAQLLPWPSRTYADNRLDAYRMSGLTAEHWIEAIVEFLGTLPSPPASFAEKWAVRENIRATFPKP